MSDLYEDTTGKVRSVYSEFLVFDGTVMCPDWFLDCYIIPGANAIVTAEGLEAATRVFAKWALPNDLLWGEMNEAAKKQARLITRKALEAAGIRIEEKTDE